jgi:hypothetical protein
MSSIFNILTDVFSYLKNEEDIKPLNDRASELFDEMKKISKQIHASESTKDKTELKKTLSKLDEELRSVSSELIDRRNYCREMYLTTVEYPPEFKNVICKINSLEHDLKIIKDKKASMVRQAFKNITKGGWFKNDTFMTNGCIDDKKIYKWFSVTIDDFLEECDEGYIHLTEFGTAPDKLVPMRLYDYTCVITFEWFRKRDEIKIFKDDLFSVFEEYNRLDNIFKQEKLLLCAFLMSTYFPDNDIEYIVDKVNKSKSWKKCEIIRSYYDNSSICPSVLHKIVLAVLIDPSAFDIYQLELSIRHY